MASEDAMKASYSEVIDLIEKLAASGVRPTEAEADQMKAAINRLQVQSDGMLDFSQPGNPLMV